MKFRFWGIGFILISLFLSSCATTSSNHQLGQKELSRDNFTDAISYLKSALDEDPDNPAILRDLGLAYFQNLEFDKSIDAFNQVLIQVPDDGKSLFYLGAAYEINNDLDNAINAYRKFNIVDSNSSLRDDLKKRLEKLTRKQISQDVANTIQNEANLDTTHIKDKTIAVVYFKYMGSDSALTPLQKGIAEMMITDLSKANALTVVERLKMQQLLEEIGFGTTGLVDAQSAPRVGKLLGASEIVNGAFIDLADEQFRIDAGITQTRTGDFDTRDVIGNLEGFFKLEKNLVFSVIDKMGIQLTQEEIDNIRKVPTESMLAFMAYCKAIDYSDQGMYEQAEQELETALQQDPEFDMAQEQLSMMQEMNVPLSPIENLIQVAEAQFQDVSTETTETSAVATTESVETTQEASETDETVSVADSSPSTASEISMDATVVGESTAEYSGGLEEPTLLDRMQNTQLIIDIGFIPGMESREPVQEQNQPTFGNTANIEIIVPIH